MSFQDVFWARIFPGSFAGITIRRWMRLLRENRFAVDSPYWGRAAAITMLSLHNSAMAVGEDLIYGSRVRATPIKSPLFVLGIFRSGTTFLQNLLAQDERFATPNLIQATFPNSFLLGEQVYGSLAELVLPRTRPQDDVKMAAMQPHEDESAISNLTGRTFMSDLSFPRRAEHYRRYFTLDRLTSEEREEWTTALEWFLRKISYKTGRPLIVKSPAHTGRIQTLLELFPDAKFLHIRRDPYLVFQSWQHTIHQLSPQMELQRPDHDDLPESIIRVYKEVYDAYFAQRDLIPAGRLHETSFESLEADPLRELRQAYDVLGLPPFADAEESYRQYIASLSGYSKNEHPRLDPHWRERVATEWRAFFDEWGYEV